MRQAYLQDSQFGDPDDSSITHKHLTSHNGVWYRQGCIAAPDNPVLKRQILTELHDSVYAGHGGQYKTIQLPGITGGHHLTMTAGHLSRAACCVSETKLPHAPYAGLLTQPDIAHQKWDQVSMDFITHLPLTAAGHDQIMVVVDTLGKLTHFVPCKMTATAPDVAKLYIDEIWKHHGWPLSVHH